MIIFDSTFLIDFMKSHNNPKKIKANRFFQEVLDSNEPFATTFVNVFEIYKGAYKSENIEKSLNYINDVLKIIPVLKFNEKYYSEYGDLSARLEKNGTPIGRFDELIAAITIYNGARLVTNNTKDFSRIPAIEIINH
jgi:predicted nucleic acid-binding protein